MSAASAGQPGIGVECAFERDVLVAAMEAGDEILAPVLHPRDRRLELAREPGHDHEFGRQRHLLAEAAADVGRDHPQIRFRHADQVGDDRPHRVRHLRRTGERHAFAGGIPGRMRGARLHRQRILPVRADIDLDPPVRACQFRVEAGRLHAVLRPRRFRPPRHARSRSAGSQRRAGADDRRRIVDFDLDEIGNVLGLLLRRARPPPRSARRRSARRPSASTGWLIGT